MSAVTRGSKVCDSCGSSLDLQARSEFCPACLLQIALEIDTTDFEEAAAAGGRIDDYELLSEVARGGMGIVYRARQLAPPRIVALKMILPAHGTSPEAVARFRAEAEAAASLDHEGILPIYAVGEKDGTPFYSMKFAEGGSLSARIGDFKKSPRESAALIAALSRAVEQAHKNGILHRDLKPGNVLFDGVGKPFVSDFGLAKWLERGADLTQTLAILGTPFYMAPEQASDARNITAAADIYSLGAILFHLLTGRVPFRADNAMDVLRQAAERQAPRLRALNHNIPADLETICLRCLEKNPTARYSSAAALSDDLERFLAGRTILARRANPVTHAWRWTQRNRPLALLTAASVALLACLLLIVLPRATNVNSPKSVAVLPFEDLESRGTSGVVASGVQDEILTRLAKVAGLKVIGRASTAHYQSRPNDLPRIASELGVAAILEGSVQQSGHQVRVNVELINARSGSSLWAESYNRDATDVLRVETEIAAEVASALRAFLTPDEKVRMEATSTDNPEAYSLYLRGRRMLDSRFAPDNTAKAQQFFERAVLLDPKFALAHAAISEMHSGTCFDGDCTERHRVAGRAEAEEALRLQPNLGEAHAALGTYYYRGERNYNAAAKEYAIAQRAAPNDAELLRSVAAMARRQGHWKAGIVGLERASALDPRSIQCIDWLADTYWDVGELAAAEEKKRRALEVAEVNSPESLSAIRFTLGMIQWRRTGSFAGMEAAAASTVVDPRFQNPYGFDLAMCKRDWDAAERAVASAPDSSFASAEARAFLLGCAKLAKGDVAAAQPLLEKELPTLEALAARNPDAANYHAAIGLRYAYLGRKAEAIAEGQRATELLPESKDAYDGPKMAASLAKIYARVGEETLALALIEHLLVTPASGIDLSELRVGFDWDSLRHNPKFQQVLANPQPRVIYK